MYFIENISTAASSLHN